MAVQRFRTKGSTNVKALFYNADDVAEIMSCSKSKAYIIIRMLNAELNMQGKLTTNGRVSKRYFDERYGS